MTTARVARDRESTRRQADRIFGEIRYQDDSGPQTYLMTQNEVSIGRGGEDLWVDLPLYTTEEISREHVRLRRDAATGAFKIMDKSRNGTWLKAGSCLANRKCSCRSARKSAWRKYSSFPSKRAMPELNLTCGAATDIGRVRERNEDRYWMDRAWDLPGGGRRGRAGRGRTRGGDCGGSDS